jgi:hypothetical protein
MDPHEDQDQCLISVKCPLIYPKWPGQFSPELRGLFGRILQPYDETMSGTEFQSGEWGLEGLDVNYFVARCYCNLPRNLITIFIKVKNCVGPTKTKYVYYRSNGVADQQMAAVASFYRTAGAVIMFISDHSKGSKIN